MLKNYFAKTLLTFNFFLFFIGFGFAQSTNQAKEISKDYNFEKLKEYQDSFEKTFRADQEEAIRLANLNGWPITYVDNKGSFHQLRKVINGQPIYISTTNTAAAASTRANYLHNGGGLGLNVEGQNMTAHVWDEGIARITHQEYDGVGGTDRYSVGDGSTTLSDHSAHVAGTIMASGFSPNAKGMAPQAKAVGYDWNNDLSEIAASAANGMLISNHSYGVPANSLTGVNSWILGAYTQDSKNLDDVMYNAPYYLYVASAGNDGGDNISNSNPLEGNSAYDKLSFDKTSKNSLVVANGQDASINGNGTLNSVLRNSGSSEGPTDDLRIKPEIMGNGTGLLSSTSGSNSQYASLTGTSMASPNVAGSLLLLQQHYYNMHGIFMKAATLKGLALHTADDTEAVGPDANTGWGLMNTKAAAETINGNGLKTWISEETLTNGGTFTMEVPSDDVNTLKASISWTDQGGEANTIGTINDSKAVLVNDLDIRVTQSTSTFMPWKLTGVSANTQDDNVVDPYERVDVAGANGMYTITVTHKGTLVGGSQNFTLIITGLKSGIALNAEGPVDQTVCSTNDATYNFNYQQIGGGTTNFTTSNVPAGASVIITPNSLSANGSFEVTFGNLANVPPDNYEISIIGDNGTETETRRINLRVLNSDFSAYPQSLAAPANGTINSPTAVSLSWSENLNAESYVVEVATNPSFSSLAFSGTMTNLSVGLTGLAEDTVYYWRVRPDNNCNNGIYSETYSFQTGAVGTCTPVSQLNDTTIEDLTLVTSTVNYPDSFIIGDVNITVDYSHTWIGDVKLTLVSPTGTRVDLINVLTCTTETNLNINFDDEAVNAIDCLAGNTNYPSMETYKPVTPLSAFNGETSNGVWTLEISDEGPGDVGVLNEWTLEMCDIISSLPPNFVNNGFTPDLNSTYMFLATDIEATTPSENATQQVYTVIELPTVGILEMNSAPMSVGDTFTQDDVNTGKITYSNTETVVFNDQFKVDIQNAANGWLANQVIIFDGTLSTNEFELGALSIWPNPAEDVINIKLNAISINSKVIVNLFDIQGRIIQNNSFNSSSNPFVKTINLNNIENGIYLLEIKQGNKKATKKIIVNN